MNIPSDPALIEMDNEAMRTYEYTPATEQELASPSQVQQAIRGLKVGKAPGPNGIPKRVLRHLPKRAITFSRKCSLQSSAGSASRQHGKKLAWCPY
jgi:hypothetical protein